MTDFELRLGKKTGDKALPPGAGDKPSDGGTSGPHSGTRHTAPAHGPSQGHPVAGYMAVATALMGIFWNGTLFVPLALIFAIISLARGQGVWGWIGLMLAGLGFISSPILMGLLGFGALVAILPP